MYWYPLSFGLQSEDYDQCDRNIQSRSEYTILRTGLQYANFIVKETTKLAELTECLTMAVIVTNGVGEKDELSPFIRII